MLFFHYLCSVKEQLNYIISQLRGYIPEEELQDLGYWIIEETTGMSRTEILTGCKDTKKIPNIEIILEKLRAHVPVQYVFEHTEWMGLDLRVTPDTLIPRPETAELIEWIIESTDRTNTLRIADIGTGSGCIAIAIKKHCKLWDVSGLDISESALKIAQENAQRNLVQINWKKVDILSENIDSYDIVVSNPPYICDKEKAEMDARVLNYEPHGALFVPDSDPLLFYRRIASLKVAKQLFFEINEAYGNEVCAMLKEMGYKNIILKHDMYGKPRMVFAAIDC